MAGFIETKTNPFLTAFPAVDSIIVGGFVLPGRWDIVHAVRAWDWAYGMGAGFDGPRFFSVRTPPAQIKMRGTFWTDEQWLLFKIFDSQIFKKPAKQIGFGSIALPNLASFALPISGHPEFGRLDIQSVVIKSVGALMQQEGGLWTIEIEMLEWRTAKILPPPPKTVIPSVAAPVPTAQTALQVEAQKLLADNAAQRAKLQ